MSESLQEKSTSESESVQKSVKVKKEPRQDIQSETERKYFDIFLPQNQHKVEEDSDLSDELIPVLIRQSEIKKHCLLDRFVKTDCGEVALITVNKDVGTPQYKPLTTRLVIKLIHFIMVVFFGKQQYSQPVKFAGLWVTYHQKLVINA